MAFWAFAPERSRYARLDEAMRADNTWVDRGVLVLGKLVEDWSWMVSGVRNDREWFVRWTALAL